MSRKSTQGLLALLEGAAFLACALLLSVGCTPRLVGSTEDAEVLSTDSGEQLKLDHIYPGTRSNSMSPVIAGHATGADIAFVSLYSDATCQTFLIKGSESDFEAGMTLSVALNENLTIYGEGETVGGLTVTPCTLLTDYEQDSSSPTLTATGPDESSKL